jgi:hypothetical protein
LSKAVGPRGVEYLRALNVNSSTWLNSKRLDLIFKATTRPTRQSQIDAA